MTKEAEVFRPRSSRCAAARRPIMPLSTFTRGVGGSASTPETFTSGTAQVQQGVGQRLARGLRSRAGRIQAQAALDRPHVEGRR